VPADLPDLPLDQPLDPPPGRFVRHPRVAPAPRWVAPLYLTLAVLLLPWIGYLAVARPAEFGLGHHRVAWVGLDVMEALALALTARLAYRRSTWVDIAATSAGVLLIVDAWFDLMTATPGWMLAQSIAAAVLLELPLAILSLWIARNAQLVNESVTRWLIDRSSRQAAHLHTAAELGFVKDLHDSADQPGEEPPAQADPGDRPIESRSVR
jgi:hypothetical protein